MNNYQEIISSLKQFIETEKVETTRSGLCYNLELDKLPSSVLYHIFSSWQHFSGDRCFPVPAPSKAISEEDFYMNGEGLYEGKQLQYRISLAQHILRNI